MKMMTPFTEVKRFAQGNYFRHRVVEYIFSILLCLEISSGTVQKVFLFPCITCTIPGNEEDVKGKYF